MKHLPITNPKIIYAIVAMATVAFTLAVAYGSYNAGVRTYKQQHMKYCTIELLDGRKYVARTRLDRHGQIWIDDVLFTQPWNRWVSVELAEAQDSSFRQWNASHFRPNIQE